jgi:hypothetical protein
LDPDPELDPELDPDPDLLVSQRYRFGDSDPDPHQNDTYPQHRGQLKQFCDVFFQNSNIFIGSKYRDEGNR